MIVKLRLLAHSGGTNFPENSFWKKLLKTDRVKFNASLLRISQNRIQKTIKHYLPNKSFNQTQKS
jgi:hypothetical protein